MQVTLDSETLRPVIVEVAKEVFELLHAEAAEVGSRIAFTEEEAAAMLGLNEHVLRDERLRGRITASQITGARIRYTRADLTQYLAGRRYKPKQAS